MNITDTTSPWAWAKFCAVRNPWIERSAGHRVNPIRNGRLSGAAESPANAGEPIPTIAARQGSQWQRMLSNRHDRHSPHKG